MSLALENIIVRYFVVITAFTLVLALLPFLTLLALLLVLIRWLLSLYKNLFKPDYGDFLSGMNNFFAADDPYTGQPSATVIGYGFYEGHLTLTEMREVIGGKLEEFETKGHRDPWFPELKQYLTTWMGFCVLKKERNFQLEEHAKFLTDLDPTYGDLEVNEENVSNVCFGISRIPFKKDRSCWEFLLHHNVKYMDQGGQTSLIIARFHHTLGDALALTKLLGHFMDKPQFFETFFKKYESSVEKREGKSAFQKIWFGISLPVLGLFELAWRITEFWDNNFWHAAPNCSEVRPKMCKEFLYTNLAPIPKERIQRLREKFGGVKFFTVILAAFTLGIKKFMLVTDVPVPEKFHSVISVPLPKKNNRLTNHLTNTVIKISVGLEDRHEILRSLENDLRKGTNSRYPMTMLIVTMFLGLFPRKFLLNYWIFTTMATTNFPGFDEPGFFAGHKMLSIGGVANMPNATTGIYLWSSGYTENLFLTVGLSKHITSSMDQMRKLGSFIMEELQALEEDRKVY